MVVEAAIVLPLCLFVLLALLQLVLLQEARLLLEYAAYRAARTGALWNGEVDRMAGSARFVLGPTVCPSRFPGIPCPPADLPALRAAAGAEALRLLSAGGGFPGLSVEVVGAVGEGDFDAVGGGGLLTVELRYWLELKIPFADAGLWRAWRAVGARRLPPGVRVAVEAAAAGGRYFVPLVSRHTMRMQSNFHRQEEP